MVSSSTVIKWRLLLYFLRFPFLIVNAYLCDIYGWLEILSPPVINFATGSIVDSSTTGNTAVLAMFICGCINDLYMLTWDIYTYGSFFAHPIVQILISLALVPPLILEIISIHKMWNFTVMGSEMTSMTSGLFSMAASLLISAFIVAVTAVFWIQSRSWLWENGTRDVWWTKIFGTKRPANDEARRLARKVWKAIKRLPHRLKDLIYRRIVDVESTQHAVTQNIVAVILLSLLVAQSVILIHGVIYEKFETREVWRDPTSPPPNFCGIHAYLATGANPDWYPSGALSSSADHVSSTIPLTPMHCDPMVPDSVVSDCRPPNNACDEADTVDITMTTNISGHSSSAGRIWVGYSENEIQWDHVINGIYDHGIHLVPGYQLWGLVTFSERRIIQSYFSDMWGFRPHYANYLISSFDWMQRTPLNNESIAWVTLQINTPERYYGNGERLVRVIEDYRQHTFLSALSSIGGLLSVLQGLHVLCFGKPLFWGMFGSKLLDPFGIFAFGSRALRKRMAARYGFDMKSRTFSAEGLSLFLRDFVLDIGPLDKGDDDDDEGDNVKNKNEESPTVIGENQAYDAIPLEGVAGDLEDDRRSIHVDYV